MKRPELAPAQTNNGYAALISCKPQAKPAPRKLMQKISMFHVYLNVTFTALAQVKSGW